MPFFREAGVEIRKPKTRGTGGRREWTLKRMRTTVPTVTTVTPEVVSPLNQPLTVNRASDGRGRSVTDDVRAEDRPSLGEAAAKVLIPRQITEIGTVVTDGTVDPHECEPQCREPGDELCGECGSSDLRWKGRDLICRACGFAA